MRRQKISTKGSHSFTAQVVNLIAQELGYDNPTALTISGEEPDSCGEIIRRMHVKGFVSEPQGENVPVEFYGTINRPARKVGAAAWERALLVVCMNGQSQLVYVKRDETGQLSVNKHWPVDDDL